MSALIKLSCSSQAPARCVASHVQAGLLTWLMALATIELALPHKAVSKVRHQTQI
jgi:hypothetical protein